MKRFFFTHILIVLSYIIYAQVPEAYKVQLLVNDKSNNTLINKTVGIRLNIIKSSENGEVVYSEVLTERTNEFGLITIEVGSINPNQFSLIKWKDNIHFMKIEIDISGGTNYSLSGISQLLEVPFAEFAKSTDIAKESDPFFQRWDKTTGIVIKENQISNLVHFKSSNETDQKFKVSSSAVIKDTDVAAWRLKSENDPSFVSSPAKSITSVDTLNWSRKSNFNGSYNSLTNRPADLAVSGNFSDLKNKPIAYNPTDIPATTNGIAQFDGSKWVVNPNGNTGQRLGVNSITGLPTWKTPETFSDIDRPFYQYNQANDYYYCTPWNYEKSYNSDRKYPLTIYLHPSGAAGSINNLGLYYLGYDSNDGIDDPRAKSFQMNNPSFVIVPQAIVDFDINKIIALVEDYKSKYRIDETRIYIIGYSLGGPASYVLANSYYDFNKQIIAGIIRLSGQSETILRNEVANKTAVWLQIGLDDFILRVTITREAYNFLKSFHSTAVETTQAITIAGNSGTTYTLTKNNKQIVKKTEYVNVGHEIGAFPFTDSSLITWLYNQKIE